MSELRKRLFDKRFLTEVAIAVIYAIVNGLFLRRLSAFLQKTASSPQAGNVLAVFIEYLVLVGFLAAIYAVETPELRRSLFTPFSVLILIVTLKYMLKWFYIGASAFPGKLPKLNSSLPWLEIMAFLNISYIPVLIASLQISKIVSGDKEKPFYALLIFNFTFTAVYLFVLSPIIVRNQAHLNTSLIIFYQFVFYLAVYFLFAFSPYFVSSGEFWKRLIKSFSYAFRRFFLVFFFSALVVFIVYILPFGIYQTGYGTSSYAVYIASKWAIVLFSAVTYYVFPAYFIVMSVKAKEDGQ
jgi:hypothetical protein